MKKIFSIKTISFFNIIEKNIWGDCINTNPYFATICILVATLVTALTTGGNIINSWFDTDIQCSWYITITIVLFLTVLNVLESILAAEDAKTATLRSLLVFAGLLIGALVGAITSVIMAIILAILAVILFFHVLSGAISGAGSSSRKSSNNGKEELETTDLIEFMTGSGNVTGRKSLDGLTFYGDNGKIYERESTFSKDWYEKQ